MRPDEAWPILAAVIPEVRLLLPDGQEVSAGPGATIGRLYTADIRIDDARVSEAHAYVSLRGSALVLLALRGRLRYGGRDVPRLELAAGQAVELARDVTLQVLSVAVPDRVLAIELAGGTRQILLGVTSIVAEPEPHVVASYQPDAAAVIWNDGLAWRIRIAGQRARPLREGSTFAIHGTELRVTSDVSRSAEALETVPRTTHDRLRIVSLFDSVQVWRDGAASPCVLNGLPARLVAELLALGGPVRWQALAQLLWGSATDAQALRHRLDTTLLKTRRLLTAAAVRRDLVTSHRNGWIELLVYPGDLVDDRG